MDWHEIEIERKGRYPLLNLFLKTFVVPCSGLNLLLAVLHPGIAVFYGAKEYCFLTTVCMIRFIKFVKH